MTNIAKLIRFQTARKLIALAMSFALSGCFPWPSGGAPDPVDLGSVATSEIEVYLAGTISEDRFQLVASLRNSDDAALVLDSGSSLKFQTLGELGVYQSLDSPEETDPDFTGRIEIDAYSAPATYRLMLNRSNGEEVELFNVLLKGEFKSNSTIGNTTTFGNGDIFEFDWGFYDEDNLLDIYPQGGLNYIVECTDITYSGYKVVERDSGIKASPFLLNIDEVIPVNGSVEFPCIATFNRTYFLFEPENAHKLLSGALGNATSAPGQIGNGAGIQLGVSPKKYEIVIDTN